jgi:hypothetical protein
MTKTFTLHELTEDEVEAFLTCHHKYLANPLTKQEKALIRDIIAVCRPLVNHRPQILATRRTI